MVCHLTTQYFVPWFPLAHCSEVSVWLLPSPSPWKTHDPSCDRGDLELFWEMFPVYWSISEIYEMLACVWLLPSVNSTLRHRVVFTCKTVWFWLNLHSSGQDTDWYFPYGIFSVNTHFMAAILLKWKALAGNPGLANIPGFHFVPLGLLCSNDSPGNSPCLTYYSFISYYGTVTG